MARGPDKKRDRNKKQRGGKTGLTPRYRKQTLQLPENHGWSAKQGYKIFVANRGDVRFEFPETWVNGHRGQAVILSDAPLGDEEARVSITVFNLPPEAAASFRADHPLAELVLTTTEEDATGRHDDGTVSEFPRRPPSDVTSGSNPRYEWAARRWDWLDTSAGEPHRWVVCRHVQARAAGVHVLISFEFYEDRTDDFEPHYHHLLDTLRLAEPVTMEGRKDLN